MNLLITPDKMLHVDGKVYKVQIGASGFINGDLKREGDLATPCGVYPIREIYYRSDKIQLPPVKIPSHQINKNDGWCDDPKDSAYNQFVKLPYPASCENLWREDRIYDIIVIIGYNDSPPITGRGSAIFIHIARDDFRPTAGCVALDKDDLLEVLEYIDISSYIEIMGDMAELG